MNESQLHKNLISNTKVLLPYVVAIILGAFGLLGSVASALVVLIALISFLLHALGIMKYVVPTAVRVWSIIILLYIVVGLLGYILRYDSNLPIGSSLNRLSFLIFLPLTAIFIQPPIEKLFQTVKIGAGLSAIIMVVASIIEYNLVQNRVELGVGNAGPFSVVSAVNYSICVFAAMTSKTENGRHFFVLASACAATCILLSGMRSMLPTLVLVPLVGMFFFMNLRTIKPNRGMIILLTCCSVMLIGLFVFVALPRLEYLLSDLENIKLSQTFDTSIGRRYILWNFAWDSTLQNPWFGVGYQEMKKGLLIYSNSNFDLPLQFTHMHNFALTALVQGGIVELISLVALIFAPLLLYFGKQNDDMSRFGIAFMFMVTLIYLLSGSVNIMFNHDVMDMMYISCAAFSIALVFSERST